MTTLEIKVNAINTFATKKEKMQYVNENLAILDENIKNLKEQIKRYEHAKTEWKDAFVLAKQK